MKLPLKVEYACRVMIQLSLSYSGGQVQRIEDLAGKECIPHNYLVQILNELRNAGLVESRRGKNGGYLLAKAGVSITLLDIVNAVEGVFLQINGQSEGESSENVSEVWQDIFEALETNLKGRTLSDMATRESADMWHI